MDYILLQLQAVITDRIVLIFIFLIVGMLLDIITGVAKGIIENNFTSKFLKKGILIKMLYFIVVIVGAMIQVLFPEVPIEESLILILFLIEISSIIENLAQLGVPIPGFLKKIVNTKRDELDGEDVEDKTEDDTDDTTTE